MNTGTKQHLRRPIATYCEIAALLTLMFVLYVVGTRVPTYRPLLPFVAFALGHWANCLFASRYGK
jgi:hypothetical protein